jgi:ABC-type amino acid transport substrate-binding protein
VKKILALVLMYLLAMFSSNSALGIIPNPIKFAVDYFYPPFVSTTRIGVYGLDISIAQALCHEMNTRCVFTPMPFEVMFKNLQEGKVDAIISAISITPERRAKFDFSMPYFKSTMSYVGSSKMNFDTTPQGLFNKRIGVGKGTSFEFYLSQTYGDSIKLKTYANSADAIAALSEGKIDLVLLDTPVANYWVDHSSGTLRTVGDALNNNVPHDEGYGIVIQAGNTELANAFNQALQNIHQNGTYTNIMRMYF